MNAKKVITTNKKTGEITTDSVTKVAELIGVHRNKLTAKLKEGNFETVDYIVSNALDIPVATDPNALNQMHNESVIEMHQDKISNAPEVPKDVKPPEIKPDTAFSNEPGFNVKNKREPWEEGNPVIKVKEPIVVYPEEFIPEVVDTPARRVTEAREPEKPQSDEKRILPRGHCIKCDQLTYRTEHVDGKLQFVCHPINGKCVPLPPKVERIRTDPMNFEGVKGMRKGSEIEVGGCPAPRVSDPVSG